MSTPTRQTSEAELNTWNQQFRASPLYRQYLTSIGVNPDGPIRLSEQQAKRFEQFMAQNGQLLPDGMKIDPAGNLNQENTLGKKVAVGAAIGGAALTGLGAVGIGPMAGMLGAGAGAAGTAGEIGVTTAPFTAAAPTAVGAGLGVGGTTAATTGAAEGFGALLKNAAPNLLRAGGAISAGIGDTLSDQRGDRARGEATQEQLSQNRTNSYYDNAIRAGADNRASGTDAWRKLQQTAYVQGGATGYTPKAGLPSYGFGPLAATAAEREGATNLQREAQSRLAGGPPVAMPTAPRPFEFSPGTINPGTGEKLAGIAAPGLDIFGRLLETWGKR